MEKFILKEKSFINLKNKGIPSNLINKLKSIINTEYPNLSDFLYSVYDLIYSDLIILNDTQRKTIIDEIIFNSKLTDKEKFVIIDKSLINLAKNGIPTNIIDKLENIKNTVYTGSLNFLRIVFSEIKTELSTINKSQKKQIISEIVLNAKLLYRLEKTNVYNAQVINERILRKSKVEFVKSLTNFFRKINNSEISEIDNQNNNTILQIDTLNEELKKISKVKGISEIEKKVLSIEAKNKYLIQRKEDVKNYSSINVFLSNLYTKTLVLIYNSWSEACLFKIINTPFGLKPDNIEFILSKSNIEQKWFACIELAIEKLNSNIDNSNLTDAEKANSKNDTKVIEEDLKRISFEYIIKPHTIRNKIMHGQWIEALNGDCSDTNIDITKDIVKIDFAVVDFWFDIHIKIADIVEHLIEIKDFKSAIKKFIDEFHDIDKILKQRLNWRLKSRIDFLNQRRMPNTFVDIVKILKSKGVDNSIIAEAFGVKTEQINEM